ncbi:peptide ABC transporter substrate-binding protein [Streptomyces pinistramenti]|uniref:peptide ABC transporter substrate-binding protein n=1 Tax=Streptomyces pinistramenti TaxID=2884812 RepID=UPI001D07D9FF|nr:ABC transporter substrate-binding protein [Streptomyces pinistramenti]MCB5909764.1 ABC transporter substrate-binding protein [Streptomyces pinistramenti]
MRGAKSATWVAGAIVVALGATACGGGSSSASAEPGVVRANWGDPQNPLEPANTNEVLGGKVLDMIFSNLKSYDPKTGEAKNDVAQSIDTKDQQTFTIKVKKGEKFSNGEAVTARSFVDAWNYGALSTNAQKGSYFFADIKGYDKVAPAEGKPTAKTLSGLKVVDDHTFTVTLNEKMSTWPVRLGYKAFAPLPTVFFSKHDAYLAKPVGNGPYAVDSYDKGKQMKLVPNTHYIGEDKPQNKGVLLKVYTDSNAAYADLQSGNLDVDDDVPAEQIRNAKSDLKGNYLSQPAGINQVITFPLYQDGWNKAGMEKVRKGLSMAIDRKAITDKVYNGTRTPATDLTSPVLGDANGYSKDVCGDACTYNPTEAKKLIKEGGGIPGGKMTIGYNADKDSHKQWVDAVCNSINKVLGNDTACVGNPVGTFGDFRNQITKREMTQPFRSGWQMDYPQIENFLTPLYATGGASNDAKFSDPKFDALLQQAGAEPDTKKATDLYKQAEKIVLDKMVSIPLWYQNGTAGWSEHVSGVQLNAFSFPVFTKIKVSS